MWSGVWENLQREFFLFVNTYFFWQRKTANRAFNCSINENDIWLWSLRIIHIQTSLAPHRASHRVPTTWKFAHKLPRLELSNYSQPFSECEAQIDSSLLRSTDKKGWVCTVPFSQTTTSLLQNNLTSKDWHTARMLWMDKERASVHLCVKHYHNYFNHTAFQ